MTRCSAGLLKSSRHLANIEVPPHSKTFRTRNTHLPLLRSSLRQKHSSRRWTVCLHRMANANDEEGTYESSYDSNSTVISSSTYASPPPEICRSGMPLWFKPASALTVRLFATFFEDGGRIITFISSAVRLPYPRSLLPCFYVCFTRPPSEKSKRMRGLKSQGR